VISKKIEKDKMKKQIIIASILLITIALIVNVSAYQKLCLTKGEIIPPFPSEEKYTCEHDLCSVCVTDSLYWTSLDRCNDEANCKFLSEVLIQNSSEPTNSTNPINSTNQTNETNHTNPTTPNITIETLKVSLNSPTPDKVYSKSVLINVTSERKVTVYYQEENSESGWKRISIDKKSYAGKINFKEGLNNITIKAVDSSGYEKIFTVGFYVDSAKPKIRTTSPSKGYAQGDFNIEFMETNPKSLLFRYGNSASGYKDYNVDFNSCSLGTISSCDLDINLSEYNNEKIYYWFTLKDIAGNSAETSHIQLNVDSINPLINNPDSIYKIDLKSRTVTFNLSVTESNFATVSYFDKAQRMAKWNLLCPKLTNGYCVKKLTLTRGTHEIDVRVLDKAGNSIIQSIEFDM